MFAGSPTYLRVVLTINIRIKLKMIFFFISLYLELQSHAYYRSEWALMVVIWAYLSTRCVPSIIIIIIITSIIFYHTDEIMRNTRYWLSKADEMRERKKNKNIHITQGEALISIPKNLLNRTTHTHWQCFIETPLESLLTQCAHMTVIAWQTRADVSVCLYELKSLKKLSNFFESIVIRQCKWLRRVAACIQTIYYWCLREHSTHRVHLPNISGPSMQNLNAYNLSYRSLSGFCN